MKYTGIFDFITKPLQREKQLLQQNQQAVAKLNKKTLLFWLCMTTVLFAGLSLFSFCSPILRSRFFLYFSFFLLFVFSWFVFKKTDNHLLILAGLYWVMVTAYAGSGYVSIYINNKSLSASTIGLICIVPPTITDKSIRTAVIMAFATAGLIAATWICKIPSLAADDTINFVCFTIISFCIGFHVQNQNLNLFDSQRQLDIQRYQDFLTRLPNRRKLFEDISKSERKEINPVISAVIMMDIDFFKMYNDSYGHQQGDLCLQKVSETLAGFGKEHNIEFYRYGGEEFIGLCTLSYQETGEKCAALQQILTRLQIPFEKSDTGFLTVSQGYAELTENKADGYANLINMADTALYHSKTHGRNKISGYIPSMGLISDMGFESDIGANRIDVLASRHFIRTGSRLPDNCTERCQCQPCEFKKLHSEWDAYEGNTPDTTNQNEFQCQRDS